MLAMNVGENMEEQEVDKYCQDETPVIYHKQNYYIVGVNSLNRTVDLQKASLVGLDLSKQTINNVSFDDLEI